MFTFTKTKFEGVYLITPHIVSDVRGFFLETYHKTEFMKYGLDQEFVQDNQSLSYQGVLRGLHYQVGCSAQGKLVRCVWGEIYDVVVDIRTNSSTFSEWFGITLAENQQMLYVPIGFAHGFYTVSQQAIVNYKTTHEYAPETERGILWNDPDIKINWPTLNPLLSNKDQKYPLLKEIDLKDLFS